MSIIKKGSQASVILRCSAYWGISNRGCGGYQAACDRLPAKPGTPHGGDCQATGELVRQYFHVIARRQGSSAIWLPSVNSLETLDTKEAAHNHPYEDWLMAAIEMVKTKRVNAANEV